MSFDPRLDYLAWQNLMAAWPISGERFAEYLLKAAREAKTATSWIKPDQGYEQRLRDFAAAAVKLPVGEFTERIDVRHGQLARGQARPADDAGGAGRLPGQ